MKRIKFLSLLVFLVSMNTISQETKEVKDESSLKIIEDVPIFPGCIGDARALKKCFSKRIQIHFMKKFDADLPNQLGLASGMKKVFIAFGINKEGYVENIKVKAPHPKLEQEVIKVLKKLPKMIPGKQNGKVVSVKYSIPFSIYVKETRAQKKARKKKERRERKERRNKN